MDHGAGRYPRYPTFHAKPTNVVEQIRQESLTLEVDDHGTHQTFHEVIECRTVTHKSFFCLLPKEEISNSLAGE